MCVVLVIFAAVSLLTIAAPATATQLGDIAASMMPGEWRQLTTNNVGIISQWFNSFGASVPEPGYDDNCFHWNSKKRKGYIVTASHAGGGPPYVNSPLFGFDDDTNTWSQVAPPALNGGSGGAHCYDGLAWDDANEVLYWRPGAYSSGAVFRYCVNNTPSWCSGRQGQWSQLPDATKTGGCYIYSPSFTYHATMNGGTLLCFDPWDNHGMIGFRESTGQWSTQIPGATINSPSGDGSCLEYSPIKRVSIFGCAGMAEMWKIDDNQIVTRIASYPGGALNLGPTNNRSIVADPVTGNFIVIGGTGAAANAMYELNPDGNGTWTLLDADLTGAGKICNTKYQPSAPCSWNFYGGANPTYGVLMYWKYTGTTTGEVWLYKHKPLKSPAPPSSLTVR